jgi:timeless
MKRIHEFLRDEDFERAVLLMRAGRGCWTDTECFGAENAQPEDELMLMKEIYLSDLGEHFFGAAASQCGGIFN